jgi:hypothetical protein
MFGVYARLLTLPALAKSIAARSIDSNINVNTGGVSLSIKLQPDGGHFFNSGFRQLAVAVTATDAIS